MELRDSSGPQRNVGAKVLYVINEWSYYAAHPGEIFSVTTLQAGGVFSGGLIAAFIAAGGMCASITCPLWGPVTPFAPGLALGHAIGRLGCFAAGCCYGKRDTSFLGRSFSQSLANQITGTPLNVPAGTYAAFRAAVELANFVS